MDYRNRPASLLQQATVKDGIETRVDQTTLLHTEFSQPLNVVILVKINLRTQAWAHVILFSSDLALGWAMLIDYYSLRFQIEFNFRDAKQYWGLEDFMNVTQTAVTKAASLSLFMGNVSYRLCQTLCPQEVAFSVLDLKATFRGYKYLTETIKMLPQKPDANLVSDLFRQIAALGRIHPTAAATVTP